MVSQNEGQWRALREFFLGVPNLAWADVVTQRLLGLEPANSIGSISLAHYGNAVSFDQLLARGAQQSELNGPDWG